MLAALDAEPVTELLTSGRRSRVNRTKALATWATKEVRKLKAAAQQASWLVYYDKSKDFINDHYGSKNRNDSVFNSLKQNFWYLFMIRFLSAKIYLFFCFEYGIKHKLF